MIKFIYFDVGGVVIKDFSGTNKWEELKTGMGIKPEQAEAFNEIFDKYEPDVCVGRDVETLVLMLQEKLDLKLPDNYSFLQDFVDRFEKNESIWPIIYKLKRKYKIGLLTNMYPNLLDAICKANLMPDITYDVVIDSSIEKFRKPQKEIFQLAQNKSGFKGEEILFIDNAANHVDAAKQFGWQGFVYDSTNTEKSNKDLEVIFL